MSLYYVSLRQRRIDGAVSAILGGLLVLVCQFIPTAASEPEPEQRTHVAIPADLFTVGRTVCFRNQGLQNIVIEPDADTFTFQCRDGLSLKDTIVRVK